MAIAKVNITDFPRGTTPPLRVRAKDFSLNDCTLVFVMRTEKWENSTNDDTAVIKKRSHFRTVYTVSDLAIITDQIVDDVTWVIDTASAVRWDGSAWVSVSTNENDILNGIYTFRFSREETMVPVGTYYYSIDIRMPTGEIQKIVKGKISITDNTVNDMGNHPEEIIPDEPDPPTPRASVTQDGLSYDLIQNAVGVIVSSLDNAKRTEPLTAVDSTTLFTTLTPLATAQTFDVVFNLANWGLPTDATVKNITYHVGAVNIDTLSGTDGGTTSVSIDGATAQTPTKAAYGTYPVPSDMVFSVDEVDTIFKKPIVAPVTITMTGDNPGHINIRLYWIYADITVEYSGELITIPSVPPTIPTTGVVLMNFDYFTPIGGAPEVYGNMTNPNNAKIPDPVFTGTPATIVCPATPIGAYNASGGKITFDLTTDFAAARSAIPANDVLTYCRVYVGLSTDTVGATFKSISVGQTPDNGPFFTRDSRTDSILPNTVKAAVVHGDPVPMTPTNYTFADVTNMAGTTDAFSLDLSLYVNMPKAGNINVYYIILEMGHGPKV
jgi:hypothetical protein